MRLLLLPFIAMLLLLPSLLVSDEDAKLAAFFDDFLAKEHEAAPA